ncbi:hypothetical protein [Dactylosporangium sp. CA-233914]|uniref:hypothetical protein n=1 Tax=Dactylosporangium sp. CA-233914 TaxID=3239934 RepID=UPI003D8C48BF
MGKSRWQVTDGQSITVREIVGNAFGLASALFGRRRSVWAWRRRGNQRRDDGPAVRPRWASGLERTALVTGSLAAVVACFYAFRAVGAGFPVPWWYHLADSWIFVGSIAATYAVYAGFVVRGFAVWWRISRRERPQRRPVEPALEPA